MDVSLLCRYLPGIVRSEAWNPVRMSLSLYRQEMMVTWFVVTVINVMRRSLILGYSVKCKRLKEKHVLEKDQYVFFKCPRMIAS